MAWACLGVACGAALQKLPEGPGAPAPDARTAYESAVAACRSVDSFTAEMSVRGSAGGQRLRGRVLVGLAAPDSAVLDAAAPFGASIFVYATRDGRATLLLPRDRRVLQHDDPAAVLEAVTGVPLGPTELRRALTGCAPPDVPTEGRSFGGDWRAVALGSANAFLRRDRTSTWRLVSVAYRREPQGSWRADYGEFEGDLPRAVRVTSVGDPPRFDVRLELSQVEINPTLERGTFAVTIPDAVSPITLEELRRSGPMAESSR